MGMTRSGSDKSSASGRRRRSVAARNFPECRGLSTEQLEDIYQETTEALLRRPYQTEEHLRNALRMGLKHRALNLHRDERRRGQILAQSAPGMYVMAEEREGRNAPELAALVHQDRLIVSEFLTELTEVEQRVFGWLVEGLQYRAIASVEGIELNVARNASRSCERKRERFQLLYDTGRLCGFRSATIQALQSGEATSEELAERAFAHLEGCAHCRAEHKTNARRLRRSFQGEAAALLPPHTHRPSRMGHAREGCCCTASCPTYAGRAGRRARTRSGIARRRRRGGEDRSGRSDDSRARRRDDRYPCARSRAIGSRLTISHRDRAGRCDRR